MRNLAFLALAGVLASALAPLPALADPREDVVNGLSRCAVLQDDRQWLDCYYGAAQPMRGHLGLTPAPQAQIQLLQQVQRPPAFGAPAAPAPLPATVARAVVRTGPPPPPKRSGLLDVWGGSDIVNNAPLKSYEVRKDGFVVTLPDGQVWAQTDADKHTVDWHDDAASMRVTISQAAMHTFNLVLNDENQHYKVKRIR
jgi:hypothetical protein